MLLGKWRYVEDSGCAGAQSWGLNETTCKSSWHNCDQGEGEGEQEKEALKHSTATLLNYSIARSSKLWRIISKREFYT